MGLKGSDSAENYFSADDKSPLLNKINPPNYTEGENDPNEKEKKTIKSIPYYKLFRYANRMDYLRMTLGTMCILLVALCNPYFFILFGKATGNFLDYVSSIGYVTTKEEKAYMDQKLYEGTMDFVWKSVAIAVITIIFQYFANILFACSGLRQSYTLRRKYLETILYQDIGWHDVNQTGNFVATFSENLKKIEDGIGEKVPLYIFYVTYFIVANAMAIILGWELAVVCLIPLPLSFGTMHLISWLSGKFTKKELEAYSKAGAIANEVFSSIRTVISFSGENKEIQRYNTNLEEAKENNIRRAFFNGLTNGFLWFALYTGCGLSLYVGIYLIILDRDLPPHERKYNPSNVIGIFFMTMLASSTLNLCAPFIQVFADACGAASKVFKVLDSEPVINKSLNDGITPNAFKGEITFENVFFRYPSRPDVEILKGLNFKIKHGETVALVGSSGCGKSTCIHLLQRFYDPNEGKILIDGIDIKTLNLSWLRGKIGVVGQEPALFATTIAENIRYGKITATPTEIERAAKKAQVHTFIKSLPTGYDTLCGERGASLSGGQKQRIAIARALVRKPSILLLDEATSALDTASEAEVQAAIDSISKECTTIIVAHRLSTIKNANRIIVFSEGNVVEEGTHHELIAKEGVYYGLVKSQCASGVESDISSEDKTDIQNQEDRRESTFDITKYGHRESLVPDKEKKTVFVKILQMNKPEWSWILTACISSLVIGLSTPAFALIMTNAITVMSEETNTIKHLINLIGLSFVTVGILTGLAYLIQFYAFGKAGEALTLRVRTQMFATMLKQEIGWFDRKDHSVGALCSTLSSDASSIQGASGLPIGIILNTLATIIISNLIGLIYQWKMTLLLLLFYPLTIFVISLKKRFQNNSSDSSEKMLQNSAGIAVEAISNIQTLAALNAEKLFMGRYTEELLTYISASKSKCHFVSFILGFSRSIIFFAYAAALGMGVNLFLNEGVSFNIIFTVLELFVLGSWNLGNTFAFAPNLSNGINAAVRFFQLIEREPEIKDSDSAEADTLTNGNIEFSKVRFSYPTRPRIPILRGLDLSICSGKTVALVGSSGSGKSTVIQLLERFYDPTAGKITIDDINIKNLKLDYLRSSFGIVSQEPNLFNLTIAENIAYGAVEDVSMDNIIEAAKASNIHNFITSLPQGYDTSLGSKGTQLSGGQKQRIAIARALIRKPKILLLDEATSALDNTSEKIVQEALDKAKENRTCIIIAHRLTTIQDADIICVVNKGKIVEIGTHQDLIEKRQIYYNFYKQQVDL